eukprot:4913134-Pyramimonas_sp.AAC.1
MRSSTAAGPGAGAGLMVLPLGLAAPARGVTGSLTVSASARNFPTFGSNNTDKAKHFDPCEWVYKTLGADGSGFVLRTLRL